ncbi:MAG: cytochrome ubiquinol oxidase subunit I [Gammaproteobacteria bacterium]
MTIDTALISRIQFAFTISFHILFPAFSIGMVTFLTVMEGMYLKTGKLLYRNICKFWTKVFALTFGMGIVSGIVMEFQFGTNWNEFTYAVGGVLGSLFTYEVLTAFFIEAGFLGVMLFGWEKVGPKLHYLATCLVFIGVTFSAFWILAANSWMQTPDGVSFTNGQFQVTSWIHVILNHSTVIRYLHMILAAWITTGFVILGICAYYLKNKLHLEFSQKCFSFILGALIILVPLQGYIGDTVGLEVHRDQPIKTAAMEGVWNTTKGAPLLLFAIPDQKQARNYWELKIPYGASLLNTHKLDGELVGLTSVPPQDRPFVIFPFYGFRIMVGMGLIMLAVVLVGLILWLRKRLFDTKWFLNLCMLTTPIGFIALWFGWITAETGRQPWIVYNFIRTMDAASHVNLLHVIVSFALIVIVYGIMFGYFYFKYLLKLLKAGPTLEPEKQDQPFQYLGG